MLEGVDDAAPHPLQQRDERRVVGDVVHGGKEFLQRLIQTGRRIGDNIVDLRGTLLIDGEL